LVQDWDRFVPFQLVADIGAFAVICFAFTIIRAPKVAACFLAFYMFLMGADDECVRWMGSRFSLQFVSVYMLNLNTDFALIEKIFMDGAVHFCITIGIIVATTIVYIYKIRKFTDKNISRRRFGILLTTFAVLAIIGLTSKWFHPSEKRWYRIQPIGVNWVNEMCGSFFNIVKPQNYEKGIKLLGGNPESEYPFWHEADDSLAYSNFRKRPLEQKPNIIIFTIESMRGWYMDIRDSATCANIPNLCEFSKTGLFFPEVHSIGYPSVEGATGIHLGIYAHPRKVYLRDRKYKKTLSLPEILGKAGYYKALFTAAEPSFTNLTPHYEDWFDYVEYDPKNSEDVPLANRMVQWLNEYNKDEPLLLNYVSATSHMPFTLQKERQQYVDPQMILSQKAPENLQERYRLVFRYVDFAIGILLKALQNSERENIIVIVGDHAVPEGYDGEPGPIDRAYTHIPIFISGNSVPKGSVDSRIVSQNQIAPTILDILKLDVSNHFVGKSLLQDSEQTVFTFRDGNYAVYNAELGSADAKAAMESWGYVLDKNLLMP
jgi:phosphoglycerol transferase MdoB-like AlkP superfamily enzyme